MNLSCELREVPIVLKKGQAVSIITLLEGVEYSGLFVSLLQSQQSLVALCPGCRNYALAKHKTQMEDGEPLNTTLQRL